MAKTGKTKPRWFEALAPTAQMFHGAGKGLGRGRGPRLAETVEAKLAAEDFLDDIRDRSRASA